MKILLKHPALRGMRGAVLATSLACAAASATLVLATEPHTSYRLSALHVALETAAPLVTLLAAFLVVSRFRRHKLLNELMLVSALTVLALSDLLFGTLPELGELATTELTAWASLAGSTLGALLFALAAYMPGAKVRGPVLGLAAGAAAATAALALAAVLISSFPVGAGQRVAEGAIPPGLAGHQVLPAPQVVMAVLYGLAAVGFLIRSEQRGRALSDAAVLEERRRVARDLHDGVVQELAYLARNLDLLAGKASAETVERLRRAVERAQAESRRVIHALPAPAAGQTVETMLAEAASKIAERFNVQLAFDGVPDLRLSEPRTEALVRIACEALTNAAQHSGTSLVSLTLTRDGQRVRLRVSDAGCGFNPDATGGGFGLIALRERAYSVGGELRITSAPGGGSEIEAVL